MSDHRFRDVNIAAEFGHKALALCSGPYVGPSVFFQQCIDCGAVTLRHEESTRLLYVYGGAISGVDRGCPKPSPDPTPHDDCG